MGKPSAIVSECNRLADGICGTYEYIERCGVSADILYRIKVIARQSLQLGMAMRIIEAERFQNGLDEELEEEDI